MICWIIGVLYAFGIGFFIGEVCGEGVFMEGREGFNWKTPCDFCLIILVSPIIAIVWTFCLFFKGKSWEVEK